MKLTSIALTAGALLIAAPALAHHSFAMFDRDKDVTMSGTVTEFEWTNPHVWIHVSVPDRPARPWCGRSRCRPSRPTWP